jgi:ppGpp synthetase/RelA/SpoT-type nucleotidyltranferase
LIEQGIMMAKEFPGGSKQKVNRAGDNVRNGAISYEDIKIIEEWRAAHRAVLNTFQATLRNRTRYSSVTVAQRHKRRKTIFDKLSRLPKMNLVRMDDVAGCRLIFDSIMELYSFRKELHRARFNHKLRNDLDKYDYIKKPKNTGYRGVHDVYEYDVNSDTNRHLSGLYVEIQYRTLVQHAWATAVEVIGFITQSQPKFQQGDERYQTVMRFASEILARAFEDRNGPLPVLDDSEVVRGFLDAEAEIHLLQTLRGLNSVDSVVTEKRNAILMFRGDEELEVFDFRDATDALRKLFELEKQFPDSDIVLVRADTSEEVRLAFKNYFADATDFLDLIDRGCAILSVQR